MDSRTRRNIPEMLAEFDAFLYDPDEKIVDSLTFSGGYNNFGAEEDEYVVKVVETVEQALLLIERARRLVRARARGRA